MWLHPWISPSLWLGQVVGESRPLDPSTTTYCLRPGCFPLASAVNREEDFAVSGVSCVAKLATIVVVSNPSHFCARKKTKGNWIQGTRYLVTGITGWEVQRSRNVGELWAPFNVKLKLDNRPEKKDTDTFSKGFVKKMINSFFPLKKLRRNGKYIFFGVILIIGAVAVYHEFVAANAWSSHTRK